MKFQLIGIAAILALTFSKIEAQTLGQSAVAGDEVEDTVTTLGDSDVAGMEPPETGFMNTENESTVEDNSSITSTPNSTATPGPNPAGNSGLDQSSPAPKAPAVSTDDADKKVSTTDDSAPDDIDTKSDDGSTDDSKSPNPPKISDASRIVFTGVSLVAVTVAAML